MKREFRRNLKQNIQIQCCVVASKKWILPKCNETKLDAFETFTRRIMKKSATHRKCVMCNCEQCRKIRIIFQTIEKKLIRALDIRDCKR